MDNDEGQNSKKCSLCKKSFGLMSKGKECKDCKKHFCNDHVTCIGEKIFLCIICEMEGIKSQTRTVIWDDIERINNETKEISEELAKIEKEKQEKICEIEKIERFLLEQRNLIEDSEKNLQNELDELKKKTEKARKAFEEANNILEINNTTEKEYLEQIEELQDKILQIEGQTISEKERKQQYGLEYENFNRKIRSGLKKGQLFNLLCERCKKLLNIDGEDITTK
ncbi:hypothetical protein SteCoe_14574 [Stentor coeruleus]|uniref:FYVE-type domain-containing protein n=1 Tax=Stentor coeruleus TaxID=5963 RepID=A0A1R2C5Q6_9CILI|nr:hypothetical protein SteCoe_14574 [Stentor coeruleus]